MTCYKGPWMESHRRCCRHVERVFTSRSPLHKYFVWSDHFLLALYTMTMTPLFKKRISIVLNLLDLWGFIGFPSFVSYPFGISFCIRGSCQRRTLTSDDVMLRSASKHDVTRLSWREGLSRRRKPIRVVISLYLRSDTNGSRRGPSSCGFPE